MHMLWYFSVKMEISQHSQSCIHFNNPRKFQVDMEEPQVFANSPDFTLDFEIVYIKKEFTQYQMKWHYAWIAITLVFMFVPKIGFFYEMMQLHQNFWSRQQVSGRTWCSPVKFVEVRVGRIIIVTRRIAADGMMSLVGTFSLSKLRAMSILCRCGIAQQT